MVISWQEQFRIFRGFVKDFLAANQKAANTANSNTPNSVFLLDFRIEVGCV
jgi:hypothetical protein